MRFALPMHSQPTYLGRSPMAKTSSKSRTNRPAIAARRFFAAQQQTVRKHARTRGGRLERLAPAAPAAVDFTIADALRFGTREDGGSYRYRGVNRVDMALLCGIDRCATCWWRTPSLRQGTARQQCAPLGGPLHGEHHPRQRASTRRSMPTGPRPNEPQSPLTSPAQISALGPAWGSSSSSKSNSEDIESCPTSLALVRSVPYRFNRILRRPVLRGRGHQLQIAEGGARRRIEGRPDNVVFYATSNRRT